MIKRAFILLVVLFIAPITSLAQHGLDWGQDIRWSVSFDKAKKAQSNHIQQVVVKIDLRKSPFRKVEKVVTKVIFLDASSQKVGEAEFSFGDGKLEPGKLHIKAFPNPYANAITVKGLELKAIVDGETYVNKPIKVNTKIARN